VGVYSAQAACIYTVIRQGCWPWGYDGHYDTDHNWCTNQPSSIGSIGESCYWGNCAPNCAGGSSSTLLEYQDGFYQGYQCDTYCTGTCPDVCDNVDGIQCDPPSPNACASEGECDICPSIEGCQTYGSCSGSTNHAPTCSITGPANGIYAGNPTKSYSYTVTTADSDGDAVTSTWSINNTGGTFSTTTGVTTLFTPGLSANGNYTITDTVTDGKGGTGTCTKAVSITPAFNLTVNTYSKTSSQGCNTSTTKLSGAHITVSKSGTSDLAGSGTTNEAGSYTLSGLNRNAYSDLNVCANYSDSTGCNPNYSVVCPTDAVSGCVQKSVPATTGDITLRMDFQQNSGFGWVTAVNGGIFASGIGTGRVPCGAQSNLSGGFVSTTVNFTDASTKAYIFSQANTSLGTSVPFIENQTTQGGWVINAPVDPALEKLLYKAPNRSGIQTITNLSTALVPGTVYKMSLTNFNNLTSLGSDVTYTINGSGVVILYIDGTGNEDADVTINASLKQSSYDDKKVLLIISDNRVKITNKVGSLLAVYSINNNPNVQASIVSSKDIIIENNDGTGAVNNPVMLTGPLVSAGKILFNRDIGTDNNQYPAQSVKYNPNLIYYLTILERANPIFDSFTGLGVREASWVYEE